MRHAAACAALLGLTACGYALVGRGSVVDPTIKRVGVPLFSDDIGRPGLDELLTEKVIEELLKRGRFDVVRSRDGVDALVEGRITRLDVVPVGFSDGEAVQTQASRYAVRLEASVRYGKIDVAEPIFQDAGFGVRDEYDIGEDPATFFDREDQSLDRLATSFARSLVQSMLEAF